MATGLLALTTAALTAVPARADAAPDPAASWHGRAIQDAHRSAVPPGPRPRALRLGTGYASPTGSRRVRVLQRMLRRLGYRPGPVDGRFGPRTAAAVRWFEVKHRLPQARGIGGSALALLRARAGGAPDRLAATTPAEPDATPSPTTTPTPPEPTAAASTRDSGGLDLAPLVIAALGLLVVMLLVLQVRRAPRLVATAVEPAPAPEPRRAATVLGYVAFPRDAEGRVPDTLLEAFEQTCADHGWSLARVIHDIEPESGRLSDRPGLFHALELIAQRRSAGLVVARLRDLTGSASDLGPLMRWMDEADAALVVLDIGLDTTLEPGRRTARALVEVSDWERRRIGERTRAGLQVARAHGRSSRPAVRDDPDLAAWIERMRAEGMSLQAIADALNAEQVPTLRGGARWRPSSVQAATGYKRPGARGTADLPPVPPQRE